MCFITRLDCGICQKEDKYAFQPCDVFTKKHKHNESERRPALDPGKRFHCPKLKWPLDPDEDATQTVCPECSEIGREYYISSVKALAEKRKRDRDHALKIQTVRGGSHEDTEETGECADDLAGHTDDHLSPAFRNLSAHVKFACVEDWKQLGDSEKVRIELLKNVEYRYITVWMPCCTGCKKPTLNEDDDGIADIEFEPNSIAWMWLYSDKVFQTKINTGFIHKLCKTCVQEEELVRAKTWDFLVTCDGFSAWAVWGWLLSRGLPSIPMNEHACLNVGYPSIDPPPIEEFMSLMSASWQRWSGVPWEDTVDYDPPVLCPLPFTYHFEPLLSLDQWPSYAVPRSKDALEVRERLPLALQEAIADIVAGDSDEVMEKTIVQEVDDTAEQLGDDVKHTNQAVITGKETITWNKQAPSPPEEMAAELSEDAAKVARPLKRRLEVDVQPTMEPRKKSKTGRGKQKWVTFRGVYIDKSSTAAIACHGVPEAITNPSTINGIRTPPSPSPKGKGKEVAVNCNVTPSKASKKSATESSSSDKKHVRFANTPELENIVQFSLDDVEVEGDDLFGNSDHDFATPYANKAAENDVDMDANKNKDADFEHGDAGLETCQYDCTHLVDPMGTVAGQIICLPLGISLIQQEFKEKHCLV